MKQEEAKKAKLQKLVEQKRQQKEKMDKVLVKLKRLGKDCERQPTLKNFEKFFDKYIEHSSIGLKMIEIQQKVGINTLKSIKMISAGVQVGYSMLFVNIITTLNNAFNAPENESYIPKTELKSFNNLFEKWKGKIKNTVRKEDYSTFIEEIKAYDKKHQLKNITAIEVVKKGHITSVTLSYCVENVNPVCIGHEKGEMLILHLAFF